MRYASTLFVTHHLIRYSGGAHEYFRAHSDRFFVYSITPTFLAQPSTFEEYRGGELVSRHEYHWYMGRNVLLQYVFFYLYWLHLAWMRVPKGAFVLTFHPLFSVGSGIMRRLKGWRTAYWVLDYFDSHTGLYAVYNRMADYYVRRLPDAFFVSPVMLDLYRKRLGPWPQGKRREAVELGIVAKAYVRNPQPGILGFIGNLKEGQGVELALEALARDQSLSLEIIGGGLTEARLRQEAVRLGVEGRVRWHGVITDDDSIAAIASRWMVGLSTYQFGEYLACADPGKIKLYWQYGLPVIMTDVTHIAEPAARMRAAAVIRYDADELLEAVEDIRRDGAAFAAGVEAMRRKYEINAYYDGIYAPYAKAGDAHASDGPHKAVAAPRTVSPGIETDPLMSVVIPAYNAALTLRGALASLAALRYDPGRFETVVVDDGSTDGTGSIIREFAASATMRIVHVRRERTNGGGPGTARNAGLDVARGRIIAFTDADCVVDPDWLSVIEKEVTEKGGVIIGGETWCDETVVFPWKISPAGQRRITANMAFDRSVLGEQRFGMDFSSMVGDDAEFVMCAERKGFRYRHVPEMRVLHPVRRMTVGAVLRRSAWRKNDVKLRKRQGAAADDAMHPAFRPSIGGVLSPATAVFWASVGVLLLAAAYAPVRAATAVALATGCVWFLQRGYRHCVMYVPEGQASAVSLGERVKTLVCVALYLPCYVVARVVGSWENGILFL